MSRRITDKESLQKSQRTIWKLIRRITFTVEPTRDKAHGDFASNIAFLLSKARKSSRIANQIVSILNQSIGHIATIEIAGGGFINFFLKDHNIYSFMQDIYQER